MITTAYTLSEAREMLALWKDCERALVSGQVSSYRVGTRECTLLDMDEIREAIERLSNIVDALEGRVRSRRVVCVVPRDL